MDELSNVFANDSDVEIGGTETDFDLYAGFDDDADTTSEPEETEDTTPQAPEAEEESEEETEQPEEEAPTTEQTGDEAQADDSLTFNAKIDHKEQSVTVKKDDLPGIYQRAQNHDRAVQRANAAKTENDNYKAVISKVADLARIMNFDGETEMAAIEAMIAGVNKSTRDSRIQELVSAGTAQEVAEFVVDQQMKGADNGAAKAEEPTEDNSETSGPPSPEQFSQDLQELFDRRPELKNSGEPFPEEVFAAYMQGENLTTAYLDYEAKKNAADMQELERQNKVFRQNQASAKKAPIRKGVSGSGKTDAKEDPWLAGFDDDLW